MLTNQLTSASRTLNRAFLVSLLCVTEIVWVQGAAGQVKSSEDGGNYDIGSLLQTLNEQIVQIYSPGQSELAREMANALKVSMFRRVWPSGKTVDAYIVHDEDNVIAGIYPFRPAMICSSNHPCYVFPTKLTGTGEWYVAREPTIGPPTVDIPDATRRWDAFIEHMAERSGGQLGALTQFAKEGEQRIEIKDPSFDFRRAERDSKKHSWNDRSYLLGHSYFNDEKLGNLGDLGQALFLETKPKMIKLVVSNFAEEETKRLKLHANEETKRRKLQDMEEAKRREVQENEEAKRREVSRKEDDAKAKMEERVSRAKWKYIKAITGLACSNPDAVRSEAQAGNVLNCDFANDPTTIKVWVSMSLAANAVYGNTPCQKSLYHKMSDKMLHESGGVTTEDLMTWAQQYRQLHPSLAKRFQTTVANFLDALNELLESDTSSKSNGSEGSRDNSSSSGDKRERSKGNQGSSRDCFTSDSATGPITVCRVM